MNGLCFRQVFFQYISYVSEPRDTLFNTISVYNRRTSFYFLVMINNTTETDIVYLH